MPAVTITEYVGPRGASEKVAFVVILGLYAAGLAARTVVVPGSTAFSLLVDYFPGGPATFLRVTRGLAGGLAAVHALEALAFARLRLLSHGVPRFSKLWWQWTLSVFVEGFPVWARFGKLVAEKQLKAR